MRIKFTLIFGLLILFRAFGQDCEKKLSLNEKDVITQNKVLKSAFMAYKINFSSSSTISFELKDRKLILVSTSTLENVNGLGKTILFTFENNEKIELEFKKTETSQKVDKQTVYFNDVEITYENLKLFAKNRLKEIKLNGINETIVPKEKLLNNIVEYTNCFFINVDKKNDLGKKLNVENNTTKIPDYYKPCNIVADYIDEFEGFHKRELHYAGIATPTEPGFPLFINLISIDKVLWMTAELDAISYCLNKQSKLNIKLEDGTIVRLEHSGDIECGKRAMYKIKFKESDKIELKKSPMKLIRLETADGNIDIPFIQIKNYFIENIDCLN